MRGAAEQHGGTLVAGAGEQRGQRWRTAKRPELRKRKGGEQEREASEAVESSGSAVSESSGGGQPSDQSYGRGREESRREASEVAESPGSAERESCVACTLLLIFGSLCQAARCSGSRLTECSQLEQRAQLQEGVPRCRRGRGSVGGPEPWSRTAPGTGWVEDSNATRVMEEEGRKREKRLKWQSLLAVL
ncbi:uncharacterized protein LOC142359798 isoform X2 [Opisthocomus hoazin]|uniref:uncharacterized protein LOC142359798 isoform X2 n=1 Tax=Opisthocomus hoazin TaxID=30419 RepID=UPI003F52F8A8